MALSKCPRIDCGGMTFEGKELKVRGANFKYVAVQCATCGSVVSVVEHLNLNSQIDDLGKDLEHDLGEIGKLVKGVYSSLSAEIKRALR